MISIPVYNMDGQQTGTQDIDPDVLGGKVRPQLLKQAVVSFLSHQRQPSARTKNRSRVEGSTRKLYRQKGTGNARIGPIRTCHHRGGGVAFAKLWRNYDKSMPKKMRRLARNNAILAKLQSHDVMIIDPLNFEAPKTKPFAAMLEKVGATKGCLFALSEHNDAVYRSGRNIPRTDIRMVEQLSAYEILRRKKLIFTGSAFEVLKKDPVRLRAVTTAEPN